MPTDAQIEAAHAVLRERKCFGLWEDLAAALEVFERAAWQPIATAPKDGTPIQARIPGHGEDNIIAWWGGLVGEGGEECSAWTVADDQEPPDCWTDGVCWAVNEDGLPSAQPTHWKPLYGGPRTAPEPQKEGTENDDE